MQINLLEEKVQKANKDLSEYQTKIALMELEMNKAQKSWKVQKVSGLKRTLTIDKAVETDSKTQGNRTETNSKEKRTETKSVQTESKVHSIETQCVLCCKPGGNNQSKDEYTTKETQKELADDSETDNTIEESESEARLTGKQIDQSIDKNIVRKVIVLNITYQ